MPMRPLYSRNAQDTTPRSHRYERRGPGLGKKIRRVWYNTRDSIGMFLWLIVGLMVSVLAWMCFIGIETWLR